MAILDIKVDSIGTSGQIPKMIYINTNDTTAEVTTAGYLNHVVSSQNIPLSIYDLAMVVTKVTPNAADVSVNLYSVEYSSGNWSLQANSGGTVTGAVSLGAGAPVYAGEVSDVLQFKSLVASTNISFVQTANTIAISSAGSIDGATNLGSGQGIFASVSGSDLQFKSLVAGTNVSFVSNANEVQINAPDVGFDQTANYSPSGNWNNSGDWNFTAGYNVTAVGQVFVESVDGSVSLRALAIGQDASLEADSVTLSGTGSINLEVSTGNLLIPTLDSATTTSVLYIDTGTGKVTSGLASASFDEAGDYTLTGDWVWQAGFDVNTADPVSITSSGSLALSGLGVTVTSGASFVLNATNQISLTSLSDTTHSSGGLYTVTAADDISLTSSTGAVTLTTSAVDDITLNSGDDLRFLAAGDVIISSASNTITMSGLPSATAAEVIYYDNGTGLLSRSPLPTPATGIYTWVALSTPGVFPLIAGTGYVVKNAGISFSLPLTAVIGATYQVISEGFGWSISQGAGQSVQVGAISSTVGAGGSVTAGGLQDNAVFVCSTANNKFYTTSLIGSLNAV